MSYKVDSFTLKQYANDQWIKLPRFQRAKTWKEKQKFELVLSVFKNYPLGCVILCSESDKCCKWLIDGRQRYTTVQDMMYSPDSIYEWARKYLSFKKNGTTSNEITRSFWKKVEDFIDYDPNDNLEQKNLEQNPDYESDDDESEDSNIDDSKVSYDFEEDKDSLNKLLSLILFCQENRDSKGNLGLTSVFDFEKFILNHDKYKRKLLVDNGKTISSKKLYNFIGNLKDECKENDGTTKITKEKFVQYISDEYVFCDEKAKNKFISQELSDFENRQLKAIGFYDLIDRMLSNRFIAVISVEHVNTTDEQKIFNLINSNGTPLTAAEILSSKPDWNKPIYGIDEPTKRKITDIYSNLLKIPCPKEFVRWDLPACLPFLLTNFDYLFPLDQISDDSASRKITLGFKIASGIFNDGIKKEDLNTLGKSEKLNPEEFGIVVSQLNGMARTIKTMPYFETLSSWNLSLSRLIGDAPTLCFIFLAYYMYQIEEQPKPGSLSYHVFRKNCFILIDELIFEYSQSLWKGSSDSQVAVKIKSMKATYKKGNILDPINEEQWVKLLEEIMSSGLINNKDINFGVVKPIIAHYDCVKHLKCIVDYEFRPDFDHIIPQKKFGTQNDKTVAKTRDNIYNLALMPKSINDSKCDKSLIEISENEVTSNSVILYEEIPTSDFHLYTQPSDLPKLKENRGGKFIKMIKEDRKKLLENE